MGFYDNLASTAARLLSKYGMDVTLSSISVGSYNPATGVNTTTTSNATKKGALFDFQAGVAELDGVLIESGDKRLLMESGTAPSVGDTVTANGVTYRVMAFRELSPAGTVVMYELLLRR